jgi:signal transduction histidine kinase
LRQAQKMEALGTFAGSVAHDFNNILFAIGANAEVALLDAQSGEPVLDSLAEIVKAHARGRDLVRQILLFSRRQEPRREIMDVAPVVEEALRLLRPTMPPGVTVRTRAAEALPPVRADALQLHQVMMNLGTNAAYAMRERGGTLTADVDAITVEGGTQRSHTGLEPGSYIRVKVADTGTGMTEEVRERLFEPFFTTKGEAGTGLGLSVVHGIVREHGGVITVTSEVGAGTTFEIYLPADTSGLVATAADRETIEGARE